MSGDDVTSSSHSALQYRRAQLDPLPGVVKSVDTGDLKSPAAGRAGSSPARAPYKTKACKRLQAFLLPAPTAMSHWRHTAKSLPTCVTPPFPAVIFFSPTRG